jgi:pyruvate,water dikinase
VAIPSTTFGWLGTPDCDDPRVVGGKAANLSRLFGRYRVPPGFVVPAVQASAALGAEREGAIVEAYTELGRLCGESSVSVAVRSSAPDEDSALASFAGVHATYLNVRGAEAVVDAARRCAESAASEVAAQYREARGMPTKDARIAILVQQLVAADASAVAFSVNPVTGDRNEVVITSNWGLGESIVSGYVTPDTFVVRKALLAITSRDLGAKERMTVLATAGVADASVDAEGRGRFSLTDDEVLEVARLAIALEAEMGAPVDVECAIAGGVLHLLQCRPITTLR